MLKISGVVTNHGSFTPPVSPTQPNPQTYFSVEIEGLSISLPPSYNRGSLPPVGTQVEFPVVAQRGQNGLKFRAVALPTPPVR